VALGVVQFRVDASHVVRLEITMVDAKNVNEPCKTGAHACCHAGCSALACSSLRGRSGGPAKHAVGAQHAAQPEAPSSTFYGHPSYSHGTNAKEPSHEPLHGRTAQRRGQVSASKREGRRPKFGIVRTKNGVVHPKRDERERKGTRRLGIQPMHAHRAAISGNQWQSDAINGNRAVISGPHSQSRCNQWPSVALDAPVLG